MVDANGSLDHLLAEVQNAVSEEFSSAECSIEISPELTEAPFNFTFHALGKKIHLLASGSATPKDFYHIATMSEGTIVTDGLAGECLHLLLEGGDDWRTPLQKAFNKKLGTDWCFLVMELRAGTAHFHIFRAQTKALKSFAECTILWLTPLITDLPPKPKIVKKVVKKSTVDKEKNGSTNGTTGVSLKTSKPGTSTKIVRKKVVATNSVAKAEPKKMTMTRTKAVESESVNGEVSGDSGVSVVDSDNEKSPKQNGNTSFDENYKTVLPDRADSSAGEFVTPRTTPDSAANSSVDITDNTITTNVNISDTSVSFAVRSNNIGKKMDKILEEEEKQKSDYEYKFVDKVRNDTINGYSNDCLIDNDKNPFVGRIFPMRKSSVGLMQTSLDRLATVEEVPVNQCSVPEMPPVHVLQLVLRYFSYKELGRLREVHPHWDELCGQALNTAYYELVKKAEKMLVDCQRRVHSNPELHDVLAILTSVQVYILNPVDILRPAIDEGVCCFPYGELLDRTFTILVQAERMMLGQFNLKINWKPAAEMARQASIHYKFNLENTMEEKLGEVVRLKALQSLQRIDSFMIDSTVNKLEKAAHMARDELEWEIEQLRHQNAQLKKDNRELRSSCMRLEGRIEAIENKLKTMARLLQ